MADSSLAFQLCGAAPVWGQAIKCANWKRVREEQNTNGFTYVWIQIQTLLLTWLEVTEKACPLLAGSQNISSLAFVNYIQVKVLDCDFSVWLSRLDSKSSSAQANNNHSIARRPFRGNPQPSRTPPHRCYLPPPRPQTYRLQGFQVVLFQGLHVVLFQGFQDVLFLLLHGLQAAPPSAGLPIDLIAPAALQKLLISCLTYSSTHFLLIH